MAEDAGSLARPWLADYEARHGKTEDRPLDVQGLAATLYALQVRLRANGQTRPTPEQTQEEEMRQ